jgi:hypothetical protein
VLAVKTRIAVAANTIENCDWSLQQSDAALSSLWPIHRKTCGEIMALHRLGWGFSPICPNKFRIIDGLILDYWYFHLDAGSDRQSSKLMKQS